MLEEIDLGGQIAISPAQLASKRARERHPKCSFFLSLGAIELKMFQSL
jgi:hypothetical protein